MVKNYCDDLLTIYVFGSIYNLCFSRFKINKHYYNL